MEGEEKEKSNEDEEETMKRRPARHVPAEWRVRTRIGA